MTTITGDLPPSGSPNDEIRDQLARAIWIEIYADPDDPEPGGAWADLPIEQQRIFAGIAAAARRHLEQQEGWHPPRRWESAVEIPEGTRFRAVGDVRVFRRLGDGARAQPPADDGIRYLLGAMDAAFSRGYLEVR
ncbi:hypothetical protein [Nocardia sp. N2S4-5]|uniref:hypothetical protein n=1 Tax=Nocardia sp. N2S4-5 TaxID=3351565 RepID=UPI0037D1AC0B